MNVSTNAVDGLGDLATASHQRVEPSMSVNKNVTTPGMSCRPVSGHPRRISQQTRSYLALLTGNPTQAYVTKTHSTATRNVPGLQHSPVGHVYRPVDETDPVGHGGDPECANCLGAGSDYRRCDPDHQAIDEAGTEHRRDYPGAALDEERQRPSRP